MPSVDQYKQVRDALVARIAALPEAPEVYTYPGALYNAQLTGESDVFFVTVSRNGTAFTPRSGGDRGGKSDRCFHFEIEVHLPWDRSRGEELELLFDQFLEDLCADLSSNATLAGSDGVSKLALLTLPQVEDDAIGFRVFREQVRVRYRMVTLDAHVTASFRWRP